jgi:hypothetical protein
MATKLSELVAAEANNLQGTTKHLGVSADLWTDVESVYMKMTPLIRFPSGGGDLDSSDELLTVVSICNQLMMCRMFLTKAVLAVLQMYRGDAFTHLRRAIETCAFAVRMSKHHDLCRIWAEGGVDEEGDDTKYRAYRDAFRTKDVYPNKSHPDHDPLLTEMKGRFDLCSKLIHGSILGMASHFGTVPKNKNTAGTRHVNLFDMPEDSLVSSFFFILDTHRLILQLFGRILEPYTTDFKAWTKEYLYVEGRLERHRQKWAPHVSALYAARNSSGYNALKSRRPI